MKEGCVMRRTAGRAWGFYTGSSAYKFFHCPTEIATQSKLEYWVLLCFPNLLGEKEFRT